MSAASKTVFEGGMAADRVGDASGSGSISVEDILLALRGATEEQCAEILGALNRGTAKKSVGRPRKVVAAAAPAALPTSDGDAPSAAAYRLAAEDVDMSTCLGRKFSAEDKRWKPAILIEAQCTGTVEDGCDLCKTCQRRFEKYVEAPKAGPWTGRVTEEPLGWVHMLGTEWAEEKKPRFSADGSISDAASVASAPSAAFSKKSAATAAEKEAAAAAKKADKEAVAAAKKAEKEAEKEAKKAEKAATAAAEKEAKKAAAAAKKAAAAAKKEAKKATAAPAAKAATETEAADAAGELQLIDGTLYMVRAENVYEYDEISEKAGSFVGRLTADETIDTDAEEVEAE
jgi:chemotaxis protein histidine kinase CheA